MGMYSIGSNINRDEVFKNKLIKSGFKAINLECDNRYMLEITVSQRSM